MKRAVYCILLSLAMVLAMLPAMTIESHAAEGLYYKIIGTELHICARWGEDYQPFDSSQPAPWWDDSADKIEAVIIEDEVHPAGISYWFCSGEQGEGDSHIQSITGLEKINMNSVEWADYAFAGLNNITLDKAYIDLSNVENAEGMFKNSSFDSSFLNATLATASGRLKNAACMFAGCKNLTEIELPAGFGPSNAQEFLAGSSVKTADVSGWTPAAGANIKGLFEGCSNLAIIKADTDADWSGITGCDGTDMFKGCNALFGGEGTACSADGTGLAFARTDKAVSEGDSAAGYFTDANARTITVKQPCYGGIITPAAPCNFYEGALTLMPDGETLTIKKDGNVTRTFEVEKSEEYEFINWTLDGEALTGTQTVTGDAELSAVIEFSEEPFAGGDGSAEDPYQISTLDEMNRFADYIRAGNADYNDKCYILTASIGDEKSCFEKETGTFYGTFDGDGYKIICKESSAAKCAALFGENRGIIKNLRVEGSFEADTAAGICHKNYGKIEACQNSATIKASRSGAGICIYNHGTVICCSNAGDLAIAAAADTGGTDALRCGLCVMNERDGIIRNCINVPGDAPVIDDEAANYFAVCGKNKGEIAYCYWDSDVQGDVEGICDDFGLAEETAGVCTATMGTSAFIDSLNAALEEDDTKWEYHMPYPVPLTLLPISINTAEITLAGTRHPYTGRAITPEVMVSCDGKPLGEKDFAVTYLDNVYPGTATVKVSGVDKYYGEISAFFEILPLTGWQLIDGDWYYFNADGTMATSKWMKDSKGWCWLGADGKMLTNGWAKDSKGWCWMGADGYWVSSKWIKDAGAWYYIKSDHYMASNEWRQDSKGWCYLGSSGKMVTNGWAKDSKGWCWMGGDGYWVSNKWVKDAGEWYYINANHYMACNEWAKDSGGWMWMNASGKITKSKWVKDGGYWYYLKANGYMATGTQTIDGKPFKFDSSGRWIQ